jgi:hypothetical protein
VSQSNRGLIIVGSWLTRTEAGIYKDITMEILWSNGPRLHGGNLIGFVPTSRGGVYIEYNYFQKISLNSFSYLEIFLNIPEGT